jgi:DNA-binding transcriptional regulator YhcF (GntR family)
MSWEFDTDRPIYKQLQERLLLMILSGKYGAGAQLPTVRELAEEAAVNPNTLQKALAELERDGLVYAQRTSGRFVTEDQGLIRKARTNLAREQTELFLARMEAIGYSRRDTVVLIQTAKETSKP